MAQLKQMYLKQLDHPIVSILMTGLAVWRLAYMLTQESGPFMVFTKLRAATGIQHDEHGKPIAWPDVNMLSCLYCTSVWMAMFILVCPKWLLSLLAYSGLAILIEVRHGQS